MSKMLLTSLATVCTLSCLAFGLATEANAITKAQMCERMRPACLARHPAGVCQSYVDICKGRKASTGGLTGSTEIPRGWTLPHGVPGSTPSPGHRTHTITGSGLW